MVRKKAPSTPDDLESLPSPNASTNHCRRQSPRRHQMSFASDRVFHKLAPSVGRVLHTCKRLRLSLLVIVPVRGLTVAGDTSGAVLGGTGSLREALTPSLLEQSHTTYIANFSHVEKTIGRCKSGLAAATSARD